jgi:hypothetical protein
VVSLLGVYLLSATPPAVPESIESPSGSAGGGSVVAHGGVPSPTTTPGRPAQIPAGDTVQQQQNQTGASLPPAQCSAADV